MIKKKHYLFYICAILIFMQPFLMVAQELSILKVSDFDLIGKVKKCTVITNYGKEEFYFNESGLLTKSITRYTDEDYNIIYYKYKDDDILEKRLEIYKDGTFDKNTSIAHFFDVETIGNKKITEKIITYSEKFLDQYEYEYDSINRLRNIKRINNDEVDVTTIVYEENKIEKFKSYFLNDVLVKTIRTSFKIDKNKGKLKCVLTKEFANGNPLKAEEVIYREDGTLFYKEYFKANETDTKFISDKKEFYTYKTDKLVLDKIKVKTKRRNYEISYLHQFDGDKGNWIKQVISPKNTYTTRKIEYYSLEEKSTEE